MSHKRTNILRILVIALTITCPFILTNTDPDAISTVDNKALADDPFTVISEDEDTTFAEATDNYFNDRIGFRQTAIQVNSRLDYYAFHKSPTSSVVLGEDGWLFYDNGVTLTQASGYLTWAQGELEIVANNVMKMKEYLEERGCEFILYIAPNKERVYYDYLPDYYQDYRLSETCNTEQIINYLAETTDVKVVWAYEDMQEYMEDNPDQDLYYKLDTHWNKLGGYIGAKALLNELGIDIPSLEDKTIEEEELDTGDLYERMGLSPELKMEDTEYYIDGYDYKADIFSAKEFYSDWKYNNTGKDERTLLVAKDSFFTNMADYVADEFDQVVMTNYAKFDESIIDEVNPDVFILEIAERNDYYLRDYTLFGN